MKSKQLANVLIKILGLSVCVHALPGLLSGIFSVFFSGPFQGGGVFTRILLFVMGTGVEAVVGIFLIINSRKVAEFLFKGEEN
jgi:hypothetical protein